MEKFNEKALEDIVKGFIADFSDKNKNDDLIQLGLTSIQIMSTANKLKKYGIRIPIYELGTKPVFNEWLRLVEKYGGNSERAESKSDTAEKTGADFLLTEIQQSYWFGRNLKKNLGNVSCHVYLELNGKNVEPDRLAEAWRKLFTYHPMIRMCITSGGRQLILPESAYDRLDVFDLRDIPENEQEKKLLEIRSERSQRKLNIADGETAGLALSLLSDGRTMIHFDLDLIAADVMSFYILMNDLCKLYSGEKPDVSPDWDYGEYLVKHNIEIKQDAEAAKAFWEKKAPDMPSGPELPVNAEALEAEACTYVRRTHKISRNDWNEFEKACSANRITPAMALLTAYTSAVERWSTENRFLMNIPIFNRDTEIEGIDKVVADFTNILLVEADCRAEDSFAERAARISNVFRENISNSAYSGVKVQKLIRDCRQEQSAILAPVVYSYTIGEKLLDDKCLSTFGDLGFMISQTPQVFIDFQIVEAGNEIIFSFDSPSELFPDTVIEGIFSDTVAVFERAAGTGDWSFRFSDEKTCCVPDGYKLPENNSLIHEGFFRFAESDPGKTALISAADGSVMTYGELRDAALRTASLLKANGAKAGDAIAVTLDRGVSQIIAIYGILAMGGHYVPVGTHLPYERRLRIHKRCSVKYAVTDKKYINELGFGDAAAVDIAENKAYEPAELYSYPDNNGLAYIILTSGTTGEPKGVAISHYNAVNTIDAVNREYGICDKDIAMAVSAIDFDLSVYDTFGILGVGGSLVVLDPHNAKDNMVWLRSVMEYGVTVWNSVPVLMEMLLMGAASLSTGKLPLKTVMLSGDWISLELPEKIAEFTENCSIAAMGGATEGAIWSNLYKVELPLRNGWKTIPYGYPLPGQLYRIVDHLGRDCRPYVKGELWIGGCGVAQCYVGDSETTAAKFTERSGIRWYKTGDYGRYREEGLIEFLGREDAQIKLNGYRVELGEIESMMARIPQISASAAVFDKKHEKIAAFYSGEELDKDYILSVISTEVPEYMLPSLVIHLDELPVTKNSKIDRKELVRKAEELNEKDTADTAGADDTELTMKLKELLGTSSLDMNAGFIANNGDSIQAMKLATWIKEAMDVEVNAFDILNLDSLSALEAEIAELKDNNEFSL